MLNQERRAWKLILFTILTFGIYSIIFYYKLNRDLNDVQSNRGIKQMNYVGIFFLGFVSLGIVPLIWHIKLYIRLYKELAYKKLPVQGYMIWSILFTTVFDWTVVCPIFAYHWLCENMNVIAEDFNNHCFKDAARPEYNDPKNARIPTNLRNINKRYEILTGVRVIKRHNFANTMTGILLLLLGILPIFFIFIPVFKMEMETSADMASFTHRISFTVVDIVKSIYTRNPSNISMINDVNVLADYQGTMILTLLFQENLYAILFWLGVASLFGIFMIALGLIQLIRGRLNHHVVAVFSTFFMMCSMLMLLADAARLGWMYRNSISVAYAATDIEMPNYYSYSFILSIVTASIALLVFILVLLIYCFGFFKKYYKEDIEYIDIPTGDDLFQPYETNDGVVRNTLPEGLLTIGGHAFSKNLNLEIANISEGVQELGPGAFANCLKLQILDIPLSVKKIDFNCFFNCVALNRINYAGTKEQWSHIKRGSNWLMKAGTTTVICTDGPISVNPYK